MILLGLLGAVGLLVWVLLQIQTPYQLVMPGPVTDVRRLIRPRPPGGGALYLTTVYRDPASAAEWVYARVSPSADLMPRAEARPAGLEYREYERLLAVMMEESKLVAQVVALRAAGFEVELTGEGVRVVAISEDSKARGVVERGDVIAGVSGAPLTSASDLFARIQAGQRSLGQQWLLLTHDCPAVWDTGGEASRACVLGVPEARPTIAPGAHRHK